jgi:hypothetical protein
MKKHLFLLLFSLIVLSSLKAQYPGTNLRGQILTYNVYGQVVPLAYARIDLFFFDGRYPPGQQWRLIGTVSTDAYGFFFFNYIIPNVYTIQVNQLKSFNIQVLVIDYRYYSFQDLGQFYY